MLLSKNIAWACVILNFNHIIRPSLLKRTILWSLRLRMFLEVAEQTNPSRKTSATARTGSCMVKGLNEASEFLVCSKICFTNRDLTIPVRAVSSNVLPVIEIGAAILQGDFQVVFICFSWPLNPQTLATLVIEYFL